MKNLEQAEAWIMSRYAEGYILERGAADM